MPVMVSVTTAAALAGVDRRTVRRWFGEGDLPVEAVLERAGLPFGQAETDTVLKADGGDVEACAELALMLMERGMHSRAIEWLQRASDKNHADAMHWLARAYIDGQGVEKDANVGLMWLAKSASLGHAVSQAQTAALLSRR